MRILYFIAQLGMILFILVLLNACGKQDKNMDCTIIDTKIVDDNLNLVIAPTLAPCNISVPVKQEVEVNEYTNNSYSIEAPSINEIESIIDPCGDLENEPDEVILQLVSGTFIAFFKDGQEEFLTVLESDVNYVTTDAQKCKFIIQNGDIIEL